MSSFRSAAAAIGAVVLAVGVGPARADELVRAPTLTASLFATFGGPGVHEARWMLGTDAAFLAGGDLREDLVRLPATGLAYTRSVGLHPLVFGLPLAAQAPSLGSAEGDGGGMTWVWVGAGLAITAGVAQAMSGGGDDRQSASNGPDEQGRCDFSDNVQGPGGTTTVVDRECVP